MAVINGIRGSNFPIFTRTFNLNNLQVLQNPQKTPAQPVQSEPTANQPIGFTDIDISRYEAEVVNSKVPVLLYVTANNCPPCVPADAAFQAATSKFAADKKYTGKIKFVRLKLEYGEDGFKGDWDLVAKFLDGGTPDKPQMVYYPTLSLVKDGKFKGEDGKLVERFSPTAGIKDPRDSDRAWTVEKLKKYADSQLQQLEKAQKQANN